MPNGQLLAGVAELGLALSAQAPAKLLAYLNLIAKWNKVYNLTAIRDTERMVKEHVLDSLAIVEHVPAGSVLDVGSGAGLPGIPLAIARPDCQVTLLDSNRKKAAFLQQAIIELSLANAAVVCTRVETYRPVAGFSCIVTRAFAQTKDIASIGVRLLAHQGVILAMKGPAAEEEMQRISEPHLAKRLIRVSVPGLDHARFVIAMTKA
jgi:16S rRNA (guanine527-N7)-methyltransferase